MDLIFPKVSVVITSYNNANYLSEAIQSVLDQTVMPYEIIVLDDNSSDGSFVIVQKFQKSNPEVVRGIRNSSNLGVSANRNKALGLSLGDWISFLDGDDYWEPDKLKNELEVLQNKPQVNYVFSNFSFVDQNGKNKTLWDDQGFLAGLEGNDIFNAVVARSFPKGALYRCELIKKSLLDQIGGFDEKLSLYEDFDLKIRAQRSAIVSICPLPGAVYRRHADGLSSVLARKHINALEYVYKKNFSLILELPLPERRDTVEKIRNILFQKRFAEIYEYHRCNRIISLIASLSKLILKHPKRLFIQVFHKTEVCS
ncbi:MULTISPECIES: glycosyltransferase [unclassified Imperialibacter]|uniref:glycosyltransferase family 2 protein n=1 Tax=unclassified Imperialibacter TaxID=2629706 RepID=UPI0012583899|nr:MULTISPECIES: glycosyltransferase [unclassified Imperialibacter]CAD5259311.1 putative Glycosyl transferase family 2 [Imperialibacter sp. 89]CAD5280139.1 putative Glycosyl transferase family 2 [Imperialibacter sp. 75]VVT31830.1 putative Glycosyl transferase family 2 [Imperialibacter sp. EC-SDR9]